MAAVHALASCATVAAYGELLRACLGTTEHDVLDAGADALLAVPPGP